MNAWNHITVCTYVCLKTGALLNNAIYREKYSNDEKQFKKKKQFRY